ncbi:DUF1746-domain-containing protein [Xylariaceae sp. FL0016]|nr:DUF1746-domain-containing protein [Xylariaceae sp. FL0016]
MNNASSPTSPVDLPSHNRTENDADDVSSPSPSLDVPSRPPHGGATNRQSPSLSQKAKDGLTKKLHFLAHLTQTLDSLVYAELCIIYYMDCSFLRLMLRWVAQALFVSPKAEDTLIAIPNNYVAAAVVPNLLCMLLHLISSLPEANEAARGYLHGGILVDFVGQEAPSSRFTLLALDVAVLALQAFMMTVNMEKDRVRNVVKPPQRSVDSASGIGLAAPTTTQDHDAEERGVLRDAPMMDETDDLEMQPLRTSDNEAEDQGAASGLPRRSTAQSDDQYDGLMDTLRSGNAILANFNIRQSLDIAWHSRETTTESAAAYAIQNVGYNATLAALAAQRRARLATTQQRPSRS